MEDNERVGEQITWENPNYRINFVKPCLTDKKKKMADAKLIDFQMNAKDMCELLINSRQFDNVNFSENLGVARIEWMGKTITLFNTGEITIRSAENLEDVKNTVEKICSILSRLKPAKEKKEEEKYKPGKVEM